MRQIRIVSRRVREIERELAVLVAAKASRLLEIPGCGVLIAARIIAETAGPGALLIRRQAGTHSSHRSRPRPAPATFNGSIAPVTASGIDRVAHGGAFADNTAVDRELARLGTAAYS